MQNCNSSARTAAKTTFKCSLKQRQAPIMPNPMLAAGLFVIEFKNGNNKFWLADFNGGDPSRTLFIENAKKFKTSIAAEKALKKAIAENPHRLLDAWIVRYTKK